MASVTNALYYAAAATTAIAGILHLVLAPNILEFNLNTGIFFIVAGIAQLFWVVPMMRKWGRPWYFAGIVGTIILIVLFAITRMPDNPITGRAGPIMPMALVIEVMQLAFIGLSIAIIIYASKTKKEVSGKTASGRT
jgi:peptidoglycan/LPS O-acetylase OafA/YrhL